jgi:hypothetical protein
VTAYLTPPVPPTIPPPSAEAKALRSIGAELDVMSEAITSLDSSIVALSEMGAQDMRTLNAKLDRIIGLLTEPATGLLPRVEALETWRGELARAHAQ